MRLGFILLSALLIFAISCDKDEVDVVDPPMENQPSGSPNDNSSSDNSNDDKNDDKSDGSNDDKSDGSNDDDSDSQNENNAEFVHTTIPSDINDLFEFRGDSTKDTVWVFLQGGATTERDYSLNLKSPQADIFPYFTDDFIVYPFQSQHINPSLHDNFDLTFEQAKVESSISVEITQKIVEHYVGMNKTVYVIGHSYGAFMVHELLAVYGGKTARKYISLNGRLDMDEIVWKGFAMGEFYFFDEDGNLVKSTFPIPADEIRYEHNMGRLNAGLGFNRYTEKLADVDLSDAIFVTSEKDHAVGIFTPKSIEFLTDKNPAEKLIILTEGHDQIFDDYEKMKELHDLIIMDN